MSSDKELNFFVEQKNWHKGIKWYMSHFDASATIRGESSPSYSFYPYFDAVPERMRKVLGEVKLIYLMRDPLERVISHYMHAYATGFEHRTLAEVLETPDKNGYISRSRYYAQISRYWSVFPNRDIMLVTTEKLLSRRRETLKRVFEFLCVDPTFESVKFSQVRHQSKDRRKRSKVGARVAKFLDALEIKRISPDLAWQIDRLVCYPFSNAVERPQLNDALRRKLVGYLQGDVAQLRAHTGEDYAEWSI